MKYIKYIGAFVLLFIIVKCLSSSPEEVSPTSDAEQWYVGGNLHKATVSEWKGSTEENKLATCGDFVVNIKKNMPMSELKIKATELKNCINEATSGSNVTDNEKVIEIAGLCAIQLGY